MGIKVLECKEEKNRFSIVVEPKDIFYVDGKGGQLGDRGTIGNSDVLEVLEDKIYVNRRLEVGEHDYTIDEARRKDIAQQHTAQHTFSAVAFNDYDYNTVGFRMSDDYTTVDLDSNDLTDEIINKIEKKVNDIINSGIDIKIYTLNHDEAMEKTGLRKPIKEKITGDVRFVEIPHIDLGACAGFHVGNTREMRLFKIINYERVKGGYTRFYFIAGDRALKDYSYKHLMSRDLCHMFSCKESQILDMVDKMNEAKLELENEMKSLAFEYSELLSKKLLAEAVKIGDYRVVLYSGNKLVGEDLHKNISDGDVILITNHGENYSVASQSVDCKGLIGYIMKNESGIKGGGSKVRGNFKGVISQDRLKECVEGYIKSI